jgi:hypothetical protein
MGKDEFASIYCSWGYIVATVTLTINGLHEIELTQAVIKTITYIEEILKIIGGITDIEY